MVRHFNESSKEFAAESIMSAVGLISLCEMTVSPVIRFGRHRNVVFYSEISKRYVHCCNSDNVDFASVFSALETIRKKRTYNTLKACACINGS